MNLAALLTFVAGACFLSGYAFGSAQQQGRRFRLYREHRRLVKQRRERAWKRLTEDLDALERGSVAALVAPEAWQHAGEN